MSSKVFFAVLAVVIFCLLTTPTSADMALVPAGEYVMGGHHNPSSDNTPVHTVYISAFFMDIFEVTNAEFCEFLNSAFDQSMIEVIGGMAYRTGTSDSYWDGLWNSPIVWNGPVFYVVEGKDNFPAGRVHWKGAAAYANWKSEREGLTPCYDLTTWECNFYANGYRLPTEAEWEKAARGGEQDPYYIYPWGDTVDGSKANYRGSGDAYEGELYGATPVGYYDGNQTPVGVDMANGYGLYDMAGNVGEYCNDWWDNNYYSYSPYYNPQGPADGSTKVYRGGNFEGSSSSSGLECARRKSHLITYGSTHDGFRLVIGRYPTISSSYTCQPSSGTVPFTTLMAVTLENRYDQQTRRIAGRINVVIAAGNIYSNWKSGWTNVGASSSYETSWNQNIPDLGNVIGDNVFTLEAVDVTPSPYNQPPYPPSGDTDTASCTVTGIRP